MLENYPIYLVTFEFFGVYLDIEKSFFSYDTIILHTLETHFRISKILEAILS